MQTDIYQFIKDEEIRYGLEIEVMENWNWSMKEHVRASILFKHGKFLKATNELATKNPYRNIVYPLLTLRYRAEDIDMKDVLLYVDNPAKYHVSFLIKKYHDDVYVREHDLDVFFDETKEEKIDIGGTIVRKGQEGPVREDMESIAFCDQTDITSGPIGFKSFFSPDELYGMEEQGWGKKENGATITLDELVTFAEAAKQQDANKGRKTDTPGKYIEVYRVHGSLPKSWLRDDQAKRVSEKEKYVRQMHVVAFYKSKEHGRTGVTLYRSREYDNPFKVHLSGRKIRNRALPMGGVEELFDPQIWTNYSEIRKKEMLDAASKVIFQTNDEGYSARNRLKDMDNLEITVVRDGAEIKQVPNGSPNIQLFTEWADKWDIIGQTTAGATEALMGKQPSAGTPFRLELLVTQQGQGLHDYRKGQFATFIAEIYEDWIIPDIAKELSAKGAKFLATLSPDEMEYVSDCLVRSRVHKLQVERVLNGQTWDDFEIQEFEQKVREEFARGGNKKFLEILKDDLKDAPLSVKVNVAGKQKDLAAIVDKMVNVFRQVLQNPAVLNDPKAAKVFNKLIEYSGLDPIDFGYASAAKQPMQPMDPQQQLPQQQLPAPTSPQPQLV